MDQWAPEDVEAHMAFLRHVNEMLEESGERVDAQALTPERTWVRYGGPDAAPVTTETEARTRCARTRPPCSAVPWRSLTRSALRPACARSTGCTTCWASGTAGTPPAATSHELAGDPLTAADAYADGARRATNTAERDHLVRRAASVRAAGA